MQMSAGFGYKPALWSAELTAMHFSHNKQHISVYKGNNCSNTADEELLKHYDNGALIGNIGEMLTLTQPNIPDLEKKRYVDNITNNISMNQLVIINDMELTANINFYNEKLGREGCLYFTQYLPDTEFPLIVKEITSNTNKENNLNMTVSAVRNQELEYFSNNLEIKNSWNRGASNLEISDNERLRSHLIHQYLRNPNFSITDELNVMKRINNHLFRLHFDVA